MIVKNSDGQERETPPRAITLIVLILLLYSIISGLAVSGFFLYLDLVEEMDGPTNNGELCHSVIKSSFGIRTNTGGVCFVRIEYVLLALVAFPLTIAFWQALFGCLVLACLVIWRRSTRRWLRSDGNSPLRIEEEFSPMSIATMLYVLGVFVISGVNAMTKESLLYIQPEREPFLNLASYLPPLYAFGGFGWLFLFAPVLIFWALKVLRDLWHQRTRHSAAFDD